jgi:hypothetical protein
MHKITIIINSKPYEVEKQVLTPDDFRELVKAPADYEVWRIVGSPDPEGQPAKNDQQVTGPITVHEGERFRVVPPGFFGLT